VKRILALDGGGIRGVFGLEVLLRIQDLLRQHYQRPDLVLADHFDFFAGTSTGAIIATALCWGMPVEEILDFYVQHGRAMFQPVSWFRPIKKLLIARFDAKPLSEVLQRVFSENGNGEKPAPLGTPLLRKLLLIVVRNHTTGSAWPVTNNKDALFNDPDRPDCNLQIPLWKLVRASAAAPVYFEPERIELGDRTEIFVDGGVTPYSNPALIAALTAILPCYRVQWPSGPGNIRLISIGSLRFSSGLPKRIRKLWLGYNVSTLPAALIQAAAWEQDYLCRCLGECIHGEVLDEEVQDLVGRALPGERWFSYVRYNQSYKIEVVEELLRKHPRLSQLDAVRSMPVLREIGSAYARQHVKLEHLI